MSKRTRLIMNNALRLMENNQSYTMEQKRLKLDECNAVSTFIGYVTSNFTENNCIFCLLKFPFLTTNNVFFYFSNKVG